MKGRNLGHLRCTSAHSRRTITHIGRILPHVPPLVAAAGPPILGTLFLALAASAPFAGRAAPVALAASLAPASPTARPAGTAEQGQEGAVAPTAQRGKPAVAVLELDWGTVRQAWSNLMLEKNGALVPLRGKGRPLMETWDVGAGVCDLVVAELDRLGELVLLERKKAVHLAKEQQSQPSPDVPPGGIPTGVPAPVASNAASGTTPARYLVVGSILRFGGGGSGLGISVGGESTVGAALTTLSMILAIARDTGHVELSMRVLDSSTGEVLTSIKASGQSKRKGMLLRGAVGKGDKGAAGGIDMRSAAYQQSVLGEATMAAAQDAAQKLTLAILGLAGPR